MLTFDDCPVGDRDIMNDEWEMACGTPKCGGCPESPGCRHCSPPDRELKPHGWGFERFEDPALNEANAFVATRIFLAGSLYRVATWHETQAARQGERNRRWEANSRHDGRLERVSDRVWDSLCDRCETHAEAVEKYERWAGKVAAAKARRTP